jgi:hypothetical protein
VGLVDAIYAIESVNACNADVASPLQVQEFWEKHGELPGSRPGRDPRNSFTGLRSAAPVTRKCALRG